MTTVSGDAIRVTGQINRVLFSEIDDNNTVKISTKDVGFSFGFGAANNNINEARKNMGELLTLPGKTMFLPAQKDAKAHYYDELDGYLSTPFNVNLGNLDDERWNMLDFQENTAEIGYLIEHWILQSDPEGKYPLYGFIYECKIERLEGAWVIKIPFETTKPKNNGKISDSESVRDYFKFCSEAAKEETRAIVVGVALDTQSKSLSKLNGKEALVFYNNPGDKTSRNRYKIHQHGVIYTPSKSVKIESQKDVATAISEKNLLDVKHILDNTVVSSVAGVLKGYDSIIGESKC